MPKTSISGSVAITAAGSDPQATAVTDDLELPPLPVKHGPVSASRARLVRVRVAKRVKLHPRASDGAILAAYERALMRTDPKRHPDRAACAYVTRFIGRVLHADPDAVALWEVYSRRRPAADEHAQAPGAIDAAQFVPPCPKDNPALPDVLRALA
jgi:hypothetical protein